MSGLHRLLEYIHRPSSLIDTPLYNFISEIVIININEIQKEDSLARSTLSVDPDKVIAALEWLVRNNDRYKVFETTHFTTELRLQNDGSKDS
jgi:hypothetical protein